MLGGMSSLVGVIALTFGLLVTKAAETLGVVEDTQTGWAIGLMFALFGGFVGAALAPSFRRTSAALMAVAAIASVATRDPLFIGVGVALLVAAALALWGREAW